MRGLIFDPFAGISGDMVLGALIDLGFAEDRLRDIVASVEPRGAGVVVEPTDRRGIACRLVRFDLPEERGHRRLADVLEIVERSGAPSAAKAHAAEAFRRLAAAESAIHGVEVERIHFHEVGSLDAILDVLCAMTGVVELGFEQFYTRPITVGRGWVEMAHGRFPLPAPATVKLLAGLPVRDAGFDGECTTPTGAAVLATLVRDAAGPGTFRAGGSGYGAGSRDPADRPNCLRLIECDVGATGPERLYVVQADVDDLSPEYVPPAVDALLAAGALDAVVHGVGMKKGRPALRIEALAPEPTLDTVLRTFFEATSTIGARYWPVSRQSLPRDEEIVEYRGQRVRRKRVRLPGGGERAKPEYEDVVRAARALGLTPYQVRSALEGDPRLGAPAAPEQEWQ